MLQNSPKTGTGDLLISVQAIEPLLIPAIKKSEETKFNELFDQIFSHHFETENTIEVENELNSMVYELYNLSKEEIKFIEKEIACSTI